MDAAQYRAAIKAFGLSQSRAARSLCVAVSTSRRYVQGKSPVPQGVAMLDANMTRSQARTCGGTKLAVLILSTAYRSGHQY